MSKQPKPAVVLVSQRAAAAGTGGAAPHAPARRPLQIHLHARRRPSVGTNQAIKGHTRDSTAGSSWNLVAACR